MVPCFLITLVKKRLFFTSLFLILSLGCFAQTIAIPDTNFEQFLIDQGIDSDGTLNGQLLTADAQSVIDLNISVNTITDVTGLEAFVNLVSLNVGTNQVLSLPLLTLTSLEVLLFSKNESLGSLDLTQNTALRVLRFDNYAVPSTLSSLDLSQNINLEELFINEVVSLTSIIFPITPSLIDINIRNLSVPTIDLSNLTGDLHFSIMLSAVAVNITYPNKRDALKSLNLDAIDFPTVDISEMIGLETLRLSTTYTEEVSLPNTNTLTSITISGHKLQTAISFASVPELNRLVINRNEGLIPLEIDVSQNSVLTDLYLDNNKMNLLDITSNVNLKTLDLFDNNFSNVDFSQNTALETIELGRNEWTVLDFSPNIELTTIRANENLLTAIDLSQNVKLVSVSLYENQLQNLDVTNNTELQSLTLNDNLFTGSGLDLSQNTELFYFQISNNQLESLDISNTAMRNLDISYNLFEGNDIINQFYDKIVERTSLSGATLRANNNLLSGTIPNFYTILTGNNPTKIPHKRTKFILENNNLHFGDFEDQHVGLISLLTTMSVGTSPGFVVKEYSYAPQAKVNEIETINEAAGNDIVLSCDVRGTQNHYKWFKDGVAIPNAPDSPELIISDIHSCDEGIYHTEITSDLFPFENGSAPGTDGKNLLLTRNDITLLVDYTTSCVTLENPLSGATDVAINTGITWSNSPGACEYILSVGTTDGGMDIVNEEFVGDVQTYNFDANLPSDTEIFITITAVYRDGANSICDAGSFTTGTVVGPAGCVSLTYPFDGATDVQPTTNFTWQPANGADGYLVNVGTTSGGTEILDMEDVGDVTTYDLPDNLPEGVRIYVTLIPQNEFGNTLACAETSFETKSTLTRPSCTSLTTPTDGATDVSVETNLVWESVVSATDYRLLVTLADGTIVVDNQEISETSYNFPADLPENTLVTVLITPFNGAGDAQDCLSESFTTGSMDTVPDSCTNLTTPTDGATDVPVETNLVWESVASATDYRLLVTLPDGTIVVDNQEISETSYNFPADLPENTLVTVLITPFNGAGDAQDCLSESFTTENQNSIPILNQKFGFSPDGDGVNEFWNIDSIEDYPDNIVSIYNRWGELVFEINNYNNTTNVFRGSANKSTGRGARELPEGTYFFTIQIPIDHPLKTKGYIIIKR